MTGFARHAGSSGTLRWVWELRSVNGKGLDIRLRLPPGCEHLEPAVRKQAAEALSRGNLQISLSLERDSQASNVVVNESVLKAVTEAVRSLDTQLETVPSSAAEILSLRGVLETAEPSMSEDARKAADLAILESFGEALQALAQHRGNEGSALATVLSGQVDKVAELTETAETDPSHTPAAIFERLNAQIGELASSDTALDPARLHQEAAVLATKADVREELDRLKAHCHAARELIAAGSPVGRKLEFLAQEFNREANTLCSKSNAVSLTAIGLELKAVIDQFREQSLNVE